MTGKVEWEVVDAPPGKTGKASSARPPMDALLGRWWRWKLAGMLALGTIALVLVIAAAGVIAMVIALAGLLTFGIARLMQWLRGKQAGAVARGRYGHPPYS